MPENRKAPSETELLKQPKLNTTLVRIEQGQSFADMVNGVKDAPRMVTNLDLDNVAHKMFMINSAGVPDVDVDKLEGEPFAFKFWMVEVATIKNEETGELNTVPRCTLFNADGEFMAFSAWSISRWLEKFVMGFGNGPYAPPIPIRIRRVSAGGNKQAFSVKVG